MAAYLPSRATLDAYLVAGVCSARGCRGEVVALVTYGCVHEHLQTDVPSCARCRDGFAAGAFRCRCGAVMRLLDERAAL